MEVNTKSREWAVPATCILKYRNGSSVNITLVTMSPQFREEIVHVLRLAIGDQLIAINGGQKV